MFSLEPGEYSDIIGVAVETCRDQGPIIAGAGGPTRDVIYVLTSRAETPEIARQLIEQMDWYDRYLEQGAVDRAANTSPGNKRGGLSNIVEKALARFDRCGRGQDYHG